MNKTEQIFTYLQIIIALPLTQAGWCSWTWHSSLGAQGFDMTQGSWQVWS